jgi:hypothetical protein
MIRFSSGDSERELAINREDVTTGGGFFPILLLLPARVSAEWTRRHCTKHHDITHHNSEVVFKSVNMLLVTDHMVQRFP